MTDTSTLAPRRSGTTAMAAIEARRLARHPMFLIGVVLAFALLALVYASEDSGYSVDLLSQPIVPAFFIGLTSLVAMARVTASTEVAAEAVATAPGTQARRTAALALAALVPFTAGLAWTAVALVLSATRPTHPNEWWFDTMPDWQVWSILVALGPVACLGGALLGLVAGRWLRFPGAAAVLVVLVVAVDMAGQAMVTESGSSEARLWVPWAMFHGGSEVDGTQVLYAGNPASYLGYLLCLCAFGVLVAVWHDPVARTRRLRVALAAVAVVGVGCLALAMTTGNSANQTSDVLPFQVAR